MHLAKIIHLTLCHPDLLKGDLTSTFMVRAPEDHSFFKGRNTYLPVANILLSLVKVVKLPLLQAWSPDPP